MKYGKYNYYYFIYLFCTTFNALLMSLIAHKYNTTAVKGPHHAKLQGPTTASVLAGS